MNRPTVPYNGNMKETFERMCEVDDLFAGLDQCGVCGSDRVKCVTRENQGYTFHEVWCMRPGCKSKIEIGCTKDFKTLYQKKKGKDGEYLPNRGWIQWGGGKSSGGEAKASTSVSPDDVPF